MLMNDETGRRNYSKYNKYITVMRVVDKKHDGKLSKSGLLSYSPKSTLVENNVQSPPSSASTPLSVYSEPQINLAAATSSASPLSSMLLEHLSKDVNFLKNLQNLQTLNLAAVASQFGSPALLQTQQQAINSAQEAQEQQDKAKESDNSKKTHFKCKKCNFK